MILKEYFSMNTICSRCGLQPHKVMTAYNVKTSVGPLDFAVLRCDTCKELIVCFPLDLSSGDISKETAAKLVEEVQETINDYI